MSVHPGLGHVAAQHPLSLLEAQVDSSPRHTPAQISRLGVPADHALKPADVGHAILAPPGIASTDRGARAFLRLTPTTAMQSPTADCGTCEEADAALAHIEQACKARTRLLAAASHDLRQPLQAIGLWIELLREQVRELEVRTILGKIQETARGAERVLDALMDISKLDLGIVGVNVTDFAVADLLDHVAVTFAHVARDHHLTLRIRNSPAIARSDPVLLERILFNFVGNAIRYSARGGVLVACRRHDEHLSLEVWDSGPGIPQDRLQEIFEEFVQLDSHGLDRSCGALGLGLSIAQRTAILLGHPLQVTSCLGRGSCFRVDVPLGEQLSIAPVASDGHDAAAAIFGAFVVVVEDEKEQRDAMEQLLRNWGCHVVAVSTTAQAIEQLQHHLRLPNVLLADYRLQNSETGFGAIRAIRSAVAECIPALILTGECSMAIDTTIECPCVSVLRKPLSPEDLRKHLAKAIVSENSHLP